MLRSLIYPFGIRFKLVFLSSFILVVPWLGYRYILEMEDYLRRSQEQSVLATAQALATALNERPELFDEANYSPALRSDYLYVYPIFYPLALNDGSLLDWREYQQYEVTYDSMELPNTLDTENGPLFSGETGGSLRFQNMLGEYNRSLYAYFKVNDDKIVYRNKDSLSVNRSDFLLISIEDPLSGDLQRFVIAPYQPEYVYPYRIEENFTDPVYEERISGQWYETIGGYEVELQIPLDMVGGRLGFAFFDVDNSLNRRVDSIVSTSRPNSDGLSSLRRPTPELDRIVEGMGHINSRIQVVDRYGRVMHAVGDIQTATGLELSPDRDESSNKYWEYVKQNILNPVYYRILTKPTNDFIDELYTGVTREGAHIDSALRREPMAQFRTVAGSQTRILEAAHPILAGDQVLGAVVVDQNMNGIRTFRNQAMETLFNTILAVMLLVTIGLFFFASRISSRIRSLRNQAENIIDDSGKIQNSIASSTNSDEIGDLSRSFSNIVERLTQYTGYLENMSSRLSHELRTPVTVVRSSLENLGMIAKDSESAVYIERADEGIKRLNLILTNMSEATRLEQMLQTSEKEKIDLARVIDGCVAGYRLAYPRVEFELKILNAPAYVNGVPEYIAQLMDKLIANAMEFSYAGEKILVSCQTLRDHVILKVANAGPYLPEEMKGRLFDSMISVRPQEKQKQPHLGIGLHIARIVADFHGGRIKADNREDTEGVVITVVVPRFYR